MKRNDLLLILVLALAGIIAFFATRPGTAATTAQVYADGALKWESPLSAAGVYEINGVTVSIEDGRARVLSSDCRDQTCVKMGAIDLAGESIVCLPNRVSVVLSGEDALDAVLD
jgi:hypothetical protein